MMSERNTKRDGQIGLGLGIETDMQHTGNQAEVLETNATGQVGRSTEAEKPRIKNKHQTPPAAKNSWDDPYTS